MPPEAKTGQLQHDWRKWTMTPVYPLGDILGDGSPAVVDRVDGESQTKIFCFTCNTGLNPDTATTICPGEVDDAEG